MRFLMSNTILMSLVTLIAACSKAPTFSGNTPPPKAAEATPTAVPPLYVPTLAPVVNSAPAVAVTVLPTATPKATPESLPPPPPPPPPPPAPAPPTQSWKWINNGAPPNLNATPPNCPGFAIEGQPCAGTGWEGNQCRNGPFLFGCGFQ